MNDLSLNQLLEEAHANAVEKGFWSRGELRNKGEAIALMHSELSEMLEAARKPAQSEKIPQFTAMEEEAADLLIRLADFCKGYGLDIVEATKAKLAFNRTRQHLHGKNF